MRGGFAPLLRRARAYTLALAPFGMRGGFAPLLRRARAYTLALACLFGLPLTSDPLLMPTIVLRYLHATEVLSCSVRT